MNDSFSLKDFYEKEALTSMRYSTKSFWESRYHKKRMTLLQKFLGICVNKRTFLDIGCGTGEYLLFAKNFASYICGMDISKNYLQRCKYTKPDGLVCGDVRYLPFKTQAIDCILCSEVIEHVHEQNQVVHEILRVSRKCFLISTPNHGFYRALIALLRPQALAKIDASVGHVHILKFRELLSKFENLKMKISFAFTVHILPPFLDEIRFPRFMANFIDSCERILNKLLPTMGNISIIYCESNNQC